MRGVPAYQPLRSVIFIRWELAKDGMYGVTTVLTGDGACLPLYPAVQTVAAAKSGTATPGLKAVGNLVRSCRSPSVYATIRVDSLLLAYG